MKRSNVSNDSELQKKVRQEIVASKTQNDLHRRLMRICHNNLVEQTGNNVAESASSSSTRSTFVSNIEPSNQSRYRDFLASLDSAVGNRDMIKNEPPNASLMNRNVVPNTSILPTTSTGISSSIGGCNSSQLQLLPSLLQYQQDTRSPLLQSPERLPISASIAGMTSANNDQLLLEIDRLRRQLASTNQPQEQGTISTLSSSETVPSHVSVASRMDFMTNQAMFPSMLNNVDLGKVLENLSTQQQQRQAAFDRLSFALLPQESNRSVSSSGDNVALRMALQMMNSSRSQPAVLPMAASSRNVMGSYTTNPFKQNLLVNVPRSLPILLIRPVEDRYKISDHQFLLRQQIEIFEAGEEDVSTHTRGRNKPITVGQVGIRCKHCAHLPVSKRQKGSTYYPSNKLGIYQAAQNMSTTHIQCGLCNYLPEVIKQQFAFLVSNRQSTTSCSNNNGAGRPYWAKSATQLGFVDTEQHGIRFIRNLPPNVRIVDEDITFWKSQQE